ncbi:hypothetical protein TREVI0001_0730 [Treponema vincentii ATCC 35580]|uniref:AAA+ ATPase domain-containing protein n=1 Tax=Treponema vincentii ATCC 35580 TaxID=596324 RepID=C8PRU5_9SPIR|nr:hypothetical protein [Treponema vincentii]EEV19862.1 hypothetical protein TREVI0001_0730 [Treponema vincentii ATCC 35580]
MRFFDRFFRWVKGPQIYALVGGNGTGKSFRARLVAQRYGIDLIIDDGLVIKGDKILAGHSAKREKTFLAAVKVAVFDDKQHRDEAAKVLHQFSRKKVLILGTSDKMVNKIAARLQIPPPQKIIRIEDIATREEIETAIRSRRLEGKHVIPVPSVEVKRNYPQIFYDKIRLLFRNASTGHLKEEETLFEKSVVRPEFSKVYSAQVSDTALKEMVMQYDSAVNIKKITVQTEDNGYRVIMMVDMPAGPDLAGRILALKDFIIKNIERYSGIFIEDFNIVLNQMIDIQTEA